MRRPSTLALCLFALAWWPAQRVLRRAIDLRPSPKAVRDVAVTASAGCPGPVVRGRCLGAARCGVGELELDGLCVSMGTVDGASDNPLATNVHVDRFGRRVVYEHLARRPEFPSDYRRYLYPVPPHSDGTTVTSGYDLDQPDHLQRRGSSMNAVGHGGVDLPQPRGTPVRAISLRNEVGDPEVVYVGWLFGNTVVLRHVVREGASLRTYLALHGHLDAPAPGLARGATVPAGGLLGVVGDSGADGIVHLHYEVRLVRSGVDPSRIEASRLNDQSVSVPCDPRNVLPLS